MLALVTVEALVRGDCCHLPRLLGKLELVKGLGQVDLGEVACAADEVDYVVDGARWKSSPLECLVERLGVSSQSDADRISCRLERGTRSARATIAHGVDARLGDDRLRAFRNDDEI